MFTVSNYKVSTLGHVLRKAVSVNIRNTQVLAIALYQTKNVFLVNRCKMFSD